MPRISLRAVVRSVIAVLTISSAVSACSLNPNDLPSVRAGVSDDYQITLQFASILNLPRGADVMMNGLRVGTVESTAQTAHGVDVVAGLTDAAKVPADTKAIIRQNTLLGDTYVALTPAEGDTGAAGFLSNGSVVALDKTTSPPPLEDTIAVLAYFVNGGTIQKIQDTMATLNRTMPSIKDVRAMAATVSIDLANLASGTSQIDRTLVGLNNMSLVFSTKKNELAAIFSDDGVHYFTSVAKNVVAHISTLLPSVGSIFIGGMWLVPMLDSAATLVESGRGEYDVASSAGAAAKVTSFLNTTLLPWASNPSVNIKSVQSADGGELVNDAKTVLRMLGAVR
ncbi:MCE family protein [Gordonia sp. TBRC 11910]|uniref:MCE family protein n=1 Tax=Gordonia asplenii TaxID=2725283 RepID=A0A848KYS8_9ACTN|nr:MlaD family protein [Gordonia asplenii]NMO03746.1 MCE family protein [Gordonia asplenii]